MALTKKYDIRLKFRMVNQILNQSLDPRKTIYIYIRSLDWFEEHVAGNHWFFPAILVVFLDIFLHPKKSLVILGWIIMIWMDVMLLCATVQPYCDFLHSKGKSPGKSWKPGKKSSCILGFVSPIQHNIFKKTHT